MFTLEINGTNYPLSFGFSFMQKMNKKLTRKDEGTGQTEYLGLEYVIAKIKDGDIETLVDVIMTANSTEGEKINKQDLIQWIENEDTDIEKVFEEVDGFFAKANCTRRAYKNVLEMVDMMAADESSEAQTI